MTALLTPFYSPDTLQDILVPQDDWQPYPTASERQPWESLPRPIHTFCLARGESARVIPWPQLPASLYLEYQVNGNRKNFETPYFLRRDILIDLVIAESIEARGRFISNVADALWYICEESSWCLPAHVNAQAAGVDLPDTTEPIVDLFAAETSALLAWTVYLLRPQLNKISPLIVLRVQREIQQRILDPCLFRDDYWWMGFGERLVNNWNPWINSNWLASVLLIEENAQRRLDAISKILRSLDRFLAPYPDDGGCDEGPSYWGVAGASLFDNLSLLYSVTQGKINIFSDPLVQNIGRYIYRAHIGGQYYINFADASAVLTPDPMLVFRFGQQIQDPAMQSFGAWLLHVEYNKDQEMAKTIRSSRNLGRILPALFGLAEQIPVPASPPLLRDVWLPGLQVMSAREHAGSEEGFFLAVKGGHNDESHNHNDVGNFIVYRDGAPLLIDVGVETYTRKTFSPERYEIWTMQSAYHGLPTFDDVMQHNGREYAATNVMTHFDENGAVFSLDIASAYPPEAHLDRWQRTLSLKPKQGVFLVDEYLLTEHVNKITVGLMTPCQPCLGTPGELFLTARNLVDNRVSASGIIRYDPELLDVTFDEIPIKDDRLKASWGNCLWRLLIKIKNNTLAGRLDIAIN